MKSLSHWKNVVGNPLDEMMVGTNMRGITHRTFEFIHECENSGDEDLEVWPKVMVIGYWLKFPTYSGYMHYDLFTTDVRVKIPDQVIHEADHADIKRVINNMMERDDR
jgi:hypothetical protein